MGMVGANNYSPLRACLLNIKMQIVSHLRLLGFQIILVYFIGFDDDGHCLNNSDAMGGKSDTLGGIVGDQADVGGLEVAKDLRSHTIVALVGLETEF